MPTKINQDIQKYMLQGGYVNERMILDGQRELINQYRLALSNVRAQISGMYSKYGDKVSYADMVQYNRLTNLEKSISDEMVALTRTSQRGIKSSIMDGQQLSFQHTGFSLEYSTQVGLSWGILDKKVLEASVYNPLNRIKWDQRNVDNINLMTKRIKQEISSGLIEGKGFYKTGQEVARVMNTGLSDATRIVWTETHRAQQTGRLQGIERLQKKFKNTDTEIDLVWDATLDSKTRPNHGAMDGVAANEDNQFLFTTSKGSSILVSGPGMTGTTDDINDRCQLVTRIDNETPKMRRDNELKKNIPYKTYPEWYQDKYGKPPVMPTSRIRK